jgi:crossover junction endodeoxyribonuclease RusA
MGTPSLFKPLVLVLPYPPSVNTYWRRGPRSTYLSKNGREYRAAIQAFKDKHHRLRKSITCDIKMEVYAFPPTAHKRDVDNIAKSLLDSLDHAGYYDDDVQIKDLRLRMFTKVPPGYVVVRISVLKPLQESFMNLLRGMLK